MARCASSTLKAFSGCGRAAASSCGRGRGEGLPGSRLAEQARLGAAGPPRLGADAAERQPDLGDGARVNCARPPRPTRGRTRTTRGRGPSGRPTGGRPAAGGTSIAVISSPCSSGCSRSGVSPGSRKKSSIAIARSPPGPRVCTTASSATRATATSDGWVAMHWSLVPRIACPRLKPCQGRAAAAGVALVARRRRVAEVAAAHPLAQVAAHRGHVPQLRRGAEQQRLGDDREPLPHRGNLRDVAHPGQRPDPQPAAGGLLDAVQRQVVDVDQQPRREHVLADQVDLGRAAGQEGALAGPRGPWRWPRRCRRLVRS